MVVSGLAAAFVISGAGIAGGTGCEIDWGCTSGIALSIASPVPLDFFHADREVDNGPAPEIDLALMQVGEGSAPGASPLEPTEEPSGDGAVDDVEGIVVTGTAAAPSGDPAEKLNAKTYEAVQAVDSAVVEPVAKAYGQALPEPIRDGVGNFLSNLGEPVNFLHFLLQLKPGKALKSLGRFTINTTLGIGGLFDPASEKPFNLEHESNGLANTLGYYGVGPGPYLYLPLIGSTTVRDLIGRVADLSVVPLAVGKPFNNPYYAVPAGALHSLEERLDTDQQIDAIREKCGDPYAATRDLYLIQRQSEINALKGKADADLGTAEGRLAINCDIELRNVDENVRPGGSFVTDRTTLFDRAADGPAEAAENNVVPEPVPEAAASSEDGAPGDADGTVLPSTQANATVATEDENGS